MQQMFETGIDDKNDTLGNMPTFRMESVLDKARTRETGADHFKEEEWIKIRVRGDNTMEIDCRVTDQHRKKYAASYAAFKAGTEQKIGDGFPLEKWAMIGAPMVKTLHGLDVYTVEQLADFPDTMIHRLHQGQTYKQRAIKWLGERNGDTEDLRGEVERLTALVAKMQTAPAKKRRKKRAVKPRRVKEPEQTAPAHNTE